MYAYTLVHDGAFESIINKDLIIVAALVTVVDILKSWLTLPDMSLLLGTQFSAAYCKWPVKADLTFNIAKAYR